MYVYYIVSGRTNTDLLPGIGLGKATFKSKVSSIIHDKEMKKLAEEGPSQQPAATTGGATPTDRQQTSVKTKAPHSGRQETTVVTNPTKKKSVPAIKV